MASDKNTLQSEPDKHATGFFRRLKSSRHYGFYLAVVCLVAATLASLAFVDIPSERLDGAMANTPWLVTLGEVATTAGARKGGLVLSVVVVLLAWRRWQRIAVTILAGFAVQSTLTSIIKLISGRPRPEEIDTMIAFYGPGHGYKSFPSGHASFAFMLATVAAAYFPRWRWVAYGAATFIALGRVILDKHFPSDAIFGALIGYVTAYLFLQIWPPRRAVRPVKPAD
jgi:undecaprenyl-diphosphatase